MIKNVSYIAGELIKMKIFNIMGYNVTYPKSMLITINEDKNVLVAIHRAEKELHCVLDFSNDNILIESGWNIKYIIKDKDICLQYNYNEN